MNRLHAALILASNLLIFNQLTHATVQGVPLVIVDTGHTPMHPGSTGASGRVEYLYNLDMTNTLSQDLLHDGIAIRRISADGQEIKLSQRSTTTPNADLFISIHHDSIAQQFIDTHRQQEFAGFSIFVSEKNTHFKESLRCANLIGQQLTSIGEKPSLYHAADIEGENHPLLSNVHGVHRYANLIVLKTAPMPAVLVEIGVIVNPTEEARLRQPETISRIASAIEAGVNSCLQ